MTSPTKKSKDFARDIFYGELVPYINKFDTNSKIMIKLYEEIAKLCIDRAISIRVANGFIYEDKDE